MIRKGFEKGQFAAKRAEMVEDEEAFIVDDDNFSQECEASYDEDYGTHYGEYAGTYAQDEAGYSDDVINDAFEGDPDLYWNID